MATKSLTFTNVAATTVTTADNLTTSPSGSTAGTTTKVGKLTGWGVLFSQGSTATWPAGASEPAFGDVHGFLLDDTSLEGQTIQAGTWSFESFFSMSTASVTGEIHFRAGVRHSDGTFTEIVNGSTGTVTVTTTSTQKTCTATQAADVTLAVGDKLYIQLDLNIASTTSGSTTATFQIHGYNVLNQTTQTTPNIVAGAIANTLTASPGAMAITGSTATPPVARKLPSSPASYSVTGAVTKLPVGHQISATAGGFAISGTAATLVFTPGAGAVAYTLTASPCAMAVTGQTVLLPVGRKLPGSPVTYAITGSSTTTPVARKLVSSPGSMTISGANATLIGPGAVVVQVDINVQRPYGGLWNNPY